MATKLEDAKITVVLDLDEAARRAEEAERGLGESEDRGRRRRDDRREEQEKKDKRPKAAGGFNVVPLPGAIGSVAKAAGILAIIKSIQEFGPIASGAIRPEKKAGFFGTLADPVGAATDQVRDFIADEVDKAVARLSVLQTDVVPTIKAGSEAGSVASAQAVFKGKIDLGTLRDVFLEMQKVNRFQARLEFQKEFSQKSALGQAGRKLVVDSVEALFEGSAND